MHAVPRQGRRPDAPRQLAFHDEIQGGFDHDAEHRWCLDCHDNAEARRAAPHQRQAGPLHRVLPALRPVPRRQVPRLARRRARQADRDVEREEDLFPLRELPQPALAAVQGAQARAAGQIAAAGAGPMSRPEPSSRRPGRAPGRPSPEAGDLRAATSCAPPRPARPSPPWPGCKPEAVVEELLAPAPRASSPRSELAGDARQAREEVVGAVRQEGHRRRHGRPCPASSSATASTSRAASAAAAASTPACKENNQSRKNPQIQWIRVLRDGQGARRRPARTPTPYYDAGDGAASRATSTCRCSASSAATRPASRSARSRPPGRSRTASWSSTTTGASAAAAACRPAPTAPATSTGPSPTCRPPR